MNFSWCTLYLFLTLSSLNIVRTVPPEYCLLPLNRSDCNMPPKQVVSYYKPGSRCEIETWRGCPTSNKFDNVYACTLHCIFRNTDKVKYKKKCDKPLNRNICGETKLVFTHEKGKCIEALWGQCKTFNKFETLEDCAAACDVPILSNALDDIIDDNETQPLQEINELLKIFIDEVVLTTTEQETEPTTESTTESTAESTIESTTETQEETTMDDHFDEVVHIS